MLTINQVHRRQRGSCEWCGRSTGLNVFRVVVHRERQIGFCLTCEDRYQRAAAGIENEFMLKALDSAVRDASRLAGTGSSGSRRK